jgi:heat-inducible transcriptional repressor
VFHHIEFLRLGERRVLVILVAPDGDVQNRVIFTARDYTQAELVEATNYLNAHYAGLTIEEVRERLQARGRALRTRSPSLMQAAVQAGTEAWPRTHRAGGGQRRAQPAGGAGLRQDLGSLRKLFDLFEQKTELMRLLDVQQPRRGRAHLHRRRKPGGALRGAVGRLRPTRWTARWSARWASSAPPAWPTTA